MATLDTRARSPSVSTPPLSSSLYKTTTRAAGSQTGVRLPSMTDLYDRWLRTPHKAYALVKMDVGGSYGGGSGGGEDTAPPPRCLMDAIVRCRDEFQTLSVQMRFKSDVHLQRTTASKTTKIKTLEFPVMLGSQLAYRLDAALHANEPSLSRQPPLSSTGGRLDPEEETLWPAPDCLAALGAMDGVFIINGIVKYLPHHLYLRNRAIHTQKDGVSTYYLYYRPPPPPPPPKPPVKTVAVAKPGKHKKKKGAATVTPKATATVPFIVASSLAAAKAAAAPAPAAVAAPMPAATAAAAPTTPVKKKKQKSCKITYRQGQFYLNKLPVTETVILEEFTKSDKLWLDGEPSPFPEGFLSLMRWLSRRPTDYDDLRQKLFFSAGHILYMLREHALPDPNAGVLFKKKIASGDLKFLLSATAKFLPHITRESDDAVGLDQIHNVFKELNLLNPYQYSYVTQQVVKTTSGYSCSGRQRRLINDSEYGFLCPLSSSDNHRVGLLLDLAEGCRISGPTQGFPWKALKELVVRTVARLIPAAAAPSTTEAAVAKAEEEDDPCFYVFLNDVPWARIYSSHVEKDIHTLYLMLAPAVRRLCGTEKVEFRHDGYVSLFLNVYPGLAFRDEISPAEYQDFLKEEKVFPTLENANLRWLLPYFPHNPAPKIIFVLHSLRCMIAGYRSEIEWFNFNEYIRYQVTPERYRNSRLEGFYLQTIYMPFRELTAEDALVISRSAARRLATVHDEQIRITAQAGRAPTVLAVVGQDVAVDTPLVRFASDPELKLKLTRKCYSQGHVVYSNRCGRITAVRTSFRKDEFTATLIVRHRRDLQVGSKLLTVHGQKSVVSAILPDDQLPRLLRDRLDGDDDAGGGGGEPRYPDIIASPESFVTRFTLGQIKESLDMGGYDTRLEGYDYPVFCGPVFYVLVNHFALDKIFSYKNKINVSRLTNQPVRGKSKFGGLKMGVSELYALTALGLSEVIYRKYITESDGEILFRCSRNGCLHVTDGVAQLQGFHGTRAGRFQPLSFSVKRCIEDYAICGYDLELKRAKHVW